MCKSISRELLIRYLMTTYPSDEFAKTVFTVAVCLIDDDRLESLYFNYLDNNALDVGLVKNILAMGTPREFAKASWGKLGMCLPPEDFQELFTAACRDDVDVDTLHWLGGALYDNIRAHPDAAISVPIEIPQRLLASTNGDARIVGLKLLRYCDVPSDMFIREIRSRLLSNYVPERYGAVYLVGQLVSEGQFGSKLHNLRNILKQMAQHDPEEDLRKMVQIYLDELDCNT